MNPGDKVIYTGNYSIYFSQGKEYTIKRTYSNGDTVMEISLEEVRGMTVPAFWFKPSFSLVPSYLELFE